MSQETSNRPCQFTASVHRKADGCGKKSHRSNQDMTDAPLSLSANASIEHLRDMSSERVNSAPLVRD